MREAGRSIIHAGTPRSTINHPLTSSIHLAFSTIIILFLFFSCSAPLLADLSLDSPVQDLSTFPGLYWNLYRACVPFWFLKMGSEKERKASISEPETKLEVKVCEAMRQRSARGAVLKSFNGLILKFPKIDESLRKCKATFCEFDDDSNGAIDHEELKKCFHKLDISFTEEEINDLFKTCDIDQNMGISFNEFIVLLCLVYLLKDDPSAFPNKSRLGMPNLEGTFETLVDAFAFLDKNNDGYVSKNEMIQAIQDSGERSAGLIALKRFEEMDWDNSGMVNFKEFLFAFTSWVGIDDDDEDED